MTRNIPSVVKRLPLYVLLAAAVSSQIFAPYFAQAATPTLNQLNAQLNQAQSDLNKYQQLQSSAQNQSNTYSSEKQQLQNQINSLQSSIHDIQGQITDKQNKITSTQQDIDQKTAELDKMNQDLDSLLATLFEMTHMSSDVTTVASGNDLSASDDRSQYLQSLQQQVIDKINQENQIKQDLQNSKTQLEQQKQQLAALKGDKEAKSANLSSQQQQVSQLLNQSQANAAQYQAYVAKLSAQKEQLSQQIYQLRLQLSRQGKETSSGGTSGYPYHVGPNVFIPDKWGFYQGECTSYGAWAMNVRFGKPFYNTDPGNGDAWNWPALAREQGYTTSSTPRVGAIVSWAAAPSRGMPYGHIAVVEGVNADGTINVSEYNWSTPHGFGTRQNVAYSQYGRATFIY